jgi:hypothetical protein
MRLGVFDYGWWEPACRSAGMATTMLSVAPSHGGNAYAADVAARTECAGRIRRIVAGHPVDLLLDCGGTGLLFSRAGVDDELCVLHEQLRAPLCSHFIDPLVTALQGLAWPVAWQGLQSTSWIKFVWDRVQAMELQRFGVPNVVHLPMAAPVREYDSREIDPRRCKPIVSFVGGQNTTFFAEGNNVPAGRLLPGTLALAAQSDLRDVSFYDAYHDVYGMGHPVRETDDIETRIRKTAAYFNLKLFYHAALCIRQRDRFVIFLKRKLGDHFRLIGNRWDEAYGLSCEPQLPTAEEYFNHFRETAININLVNGNAESGLNMRHFEITAAGGFMLCYDQPELAECFEIGKECDVFRSEADLLDKIRYYLSHPGERGAIARAGQRRTLSEHLYTHRLKTILRTVQPLLCPHSIATESSEELVLR